MIVIEALVAFLLIVGGVFGFVGSYGLVKLPDFMARLHAPTKATTLGVGGVLLASMLYFTVIQGQATAHELLITLFLFITAPVTANMVAKAWLHRTHGSAGLPDTGRDCGWANFDTPRRPSEDGERASTRPAVTTVPRDE